MYAKAFNAPELDTTRFAMRYIAYSLAGDAATNTARELIRAALEPDLTFYDRHGRATEDSYYPLSVGGKLLYWTRSTYAVRNFISAALLASRPVIPHEPVEPVVGDPSTWHGYPNYDTAYDHYGDSLLGWKDGIENDVRYRAGSRAAWPSRKRRQPCKTWSSRFCSTWTRAMCRWVRATLPGSVLATPWRDSGSPTPTRAIAR